jgi:hypothetical protein
MADTTYQPKVYRKQGGEELVVADGGIIRVESGGSIISESGAIMTLPDVALEVGDLALEDAKIIVGNAAGKAAAVTPTGDVTITNAGVTAIGAGKVTSSMLANGAGVAALLTAGLGGSQTVIKTETGAKTIVAAHGTKDRAVIGMVVVDEAFAKGDTSATVITIGETDTPNKGMANTVLVDGVAAGAVFFFAFTNSATKAITITSTAAAGTGTGGCSVTVLAIPTT